MPLFVRSTFDPVFTPSKSKASLLEDVVPALGNMLVVVAVSFSANALLMLLEKQLASA